MQQFVYRFKRDGTGCNKRSKKYGFHLPRVMDRSPLTMVGEFKYLMNIYEGEDDTKAMKLIAQAITLFMNEYGKTLPINAEMTFLSCMPSELYLESQSEYGK